MLYKNPFERYPDIQKLRLEFEQKFNKVPPGINYDEYHSMEEYKQHLLKVFEKENAKLESKE